MNQLNKLTKNEQFISDKDGNVQFVVIPARSYQAIVDVSRGSRFGFGDGKGRQRERAMASTGLFP